MSTYPKITVRPPGPKARELVKRDEQVISPSFVRYYPLVIDGGKDCIVKDIDGNEYIDFNSGLLCLNVGHSHPKIIEAIKKQTDRYLHYSMTDFYYPEVTELAEKIRTITPGKWDKKVYFGNSGTEAIEAAIKLTKWHTRRPRFIAFIGAFHGRTMGAVSFTASRPVQRRHFFPLMPGVTHVPYAYCYRCPFKMTHPECDYWCIDYIDEQVLQKYVPPEEVAAFVFEPIQGEGGYIVPPPEYFQKLKKLADKYGILLIDDEVQAGIGRTGRWCAIENWKTEPDVVCLAKAIASGLPLSAIVAKTKIMDWEPGAHATTFGGNPVACAASLMVLDVINNEHLMDNAVKQGNHTMKRLNEYKETSEILGDVRGKGLMIGAEIVEDQKSKTPAPKKAEEIMLRSWKRGVLAITCGRSTIRIAPPLTITKELADPALDILIDTMKEVEKEKET